MRPPNKHLRLKDSYDSQDLHQILNQMILCWLRYVALHFFSFSNILTQHSSVVKSSTQKDVVGTFPLFEVIVTYFIKAHYTPFTALRETRSYHRCIWAVFIQVKTALMLAYVGGEHPNRPKDPRCKLFPQCFSH